MSEVANLWVDTYSPDTIEQCILPTETKNYFQQFVDKGTIDQHLLLCGAAGTGKTTVATTLCKVLELDYMFINASEDRNIDLLRDRIKRFCSAKSLKGSTGKPKVVILDEADYLNAQSTQPALRAFMEEFGRKNCRFILTCNFKNRLIEPLHSRCANIEFAIPKEEKQALMGKAMKSICSILDKENVQYSKPVIAEVIMQYFPDMRRTLNEIQKYARASGNNIDTGILSSIKDMEVESLVAFMKKREFEKTRKWVNDNSDNEPSILYKRMYETLYEHIKQDSIPHAVVILADYQYKSAFVADQELNLLACLTELMMQCEFK